MSETDLSESARSSVVEHSTFNRVADGSNPSGRTTQSDDIDTLLHAMEGELLEADFGQDEDAAEKAHRHATTCRGAIDEITKLTSQLDEARARIKLVADAHEETAAKLHSYIRLAGDQMDQIQAARAKDIEECAQIAANFATRSFDSEHAHPRVEVRFFQRDAAFEIEKDIRALIAGSTT